MTRYGDYLKIIPNQIRACAKSMKFENWETIGQNSFWDGYCTSHKRRIPKQRQLQDNTCCEKCLFWLGNITWTSFCSIREYGVEWGRLLKWVEWEDFFNWVAWERLSRLSWRRTAFSTGLDGDGFFTELGGDVILVWVEWGRLVQMIWMGTSLFKWVGRERLSNLVGRGRLFQLGWTGTAFPTGLNRDGFSNWVE
jgi:hypothetical protein